MPVCVSFQENAGYKLETFATRCAYVGVLSVVATGTASAIGVLSVFATDTVSDMVELTHEFGESASVICMISHSLRARCQLMVSS